MSGSGAPKAGPRNKSESISMLQGKDGLTQQSQKPYLVQTIPPSKMQPVKKALHEPDSFNPMERFKDTSSLLYCPCHSRAEENSFLELPKADA